MKKVLTVITISFILTVKLFGQNIDSLKLLGKEIPEGYSISEVNNCISIQACTFYDNPDLYASIIGKIKNKTLQSLESKKDKGSIMYFEFENGFKNGNFLGSLLWGGDKPTKEHPEQYFSKGNYLIIWSFKKESPIINISQDKIKAILN
jgi:hypothetical protein